MKYFRNNWKLKDHNWKIYPRFGAFDFVFSSIILFVSDKVGKIANTGNFSYKYCFLVDGHNNVSWPWNFWIQTLSSVWCLPGGIQTDQAGYYGFFLSLKPHRRKNMLPQRSSSILWVQTWVASHFSQKFWGRNCFFPNKFYKITNIAQTCNWTESHGFSFNTKKSLG